MKVKDVVKLPEKKPHSKYSSNPAICFEYLGFNQAIDEIGNLDFNLAERLDKEKVISKIFKPIADNVNETGILPQKMLFDKLADALLANIESCLKKEGE